MPALRRATSLMACVDELKVAMIAASLPVKLFSVTSNSAAVARSACLCVSNWKQLRPLAHSCKRTTTPSRSK